MNRQKKQIFFAFLSVFEVFYASGIGK